MKVKVLKDMERGRVEGRLQVTDCSDINIVIQSISAWVSLGILPFAETVKDGVHNAYLVTPKA
jgi:hypothetical protein